MFALDSITEGLRVTWQGETLLEYHFPSEGARPYWHPLRLPYSPELTMNQPADHPHHQGLWVAWKSINGINFWEQPSLEGKTAGFGRIVHQRVLNSEVQEDALVKFSVENSWQEWDGRFHLAERRTTFVYPPQPDHWYMDVILAFQATVQEVTFDLRRGDPGAPGLFYSGLALRFHNAMTPGQLLDSEGRSEVEAIFGNTARWCDFTGQHAEDEQIYGIAILDHPENPRYPTPWWVRNSENYGIIHPSPCYHEPLTLAEGESVRFKYRLVIHRGPVNRRLLEDLSG